MMAKKLGRQGAKARITELTDELIRHNWLYHSMNAPEISDREYDLLFEELKTLEEKYPEFIREDSPTRAVGATPALAAKDVGVTHEIPLLSLDNTYSPEEVLLFDERVRGVIENPVYEIEPKIDGVAVALTYSNGELALAATRGDGLTGEDVTRNVTTIAELPKKLSKKSAFAKGDLHLRGEIYISKKRFAEIVAEMMEAGETPFANPRNTAAGTLKLQDHDEVARRRLGIFIHSFAGMKANHFDLMAKLEKAGFPVVPGRTLCDSAAKIVDEISRRESERRSYEFETDGLVIKVDSASHREELGEKSRSPRWAIAYKFAPETAETKLLAIELQVGRTGAVTPVAKLEPVHLSGTTVSSATLHNEDEIRRLDLRVGDTVVVQKAGEIIPQVIKVIPAKKRGAEFRMPEECPVCGSVLARDEGKIKIRCLSRTCPATARARLIHFGSRRAMGIDGLGESTVDALMEAKLIAEPTDLYELQLEAVAALPRMAEKSAKNLLTSIEASKKQPMERFIFALGIPGIGESTARDLADAFGSMKRLIEADEASLVRVREIGETLARYMRETFSDPKFVTMLERMKKLGVAALTEERSATTSSDGPLAGRRVVVTGSIPGLDRRQAEDAVRRLGGTVQSSVGAKTDLLVLGIDPGSKHNEAQKRGIEIMEHEKFLELLQN